MMPARNSNSAINITQEVAKFSIDNDLQVENV